MYKATRDFIKARKLFTNGYPLKKIDNVKKIDGGVENKCYSNSYNFKEENAKIGKRMFMISGWLIQPYHKESNSVSIIAHWWNADEHGNHFDTSPQILNNEEYVQDYDLYRFCIENDERLQTHVAYDLLYQNGTYQVLIDGEIMMFKEINNLKTENLFSLT